MIYQKSELLALEKELQKYKCTFYSEFWKRDITVIDIDRWLEDSGALKNKAVVFESFDKEPLYAKLQDKLSQMYFMVGKREYAQKMETKELDELAKKMRV